MVSASPVQSALLDSKTRLAWGGPWAAWSSSRPASAASGFVSTKSDDGSWPNDCNHTGPATGSVKAPLWSSTLCEQPLTVSEAEVLERPVSQSSVRSTRRAALSSASRSWTSPLLVNKPIEPTGVSSVEATLEDFRRQRLLTKDFIVQRGDMNLTVIEAEKQGDSGLYELGLFHGQSARIKAARKRPPMKPIEEDHAILDPRGRTPSRSSARKPSKSGRSSIRELQELCGLLKHEAVEMRKRMQQEEPHQQRIHRRKATVCNSMQQNMVTRQAVERAVEAKFRDEISYATPNDEELSQKFGILVHELMEKYGSLGNAMQVIDKLKKGRIGRHDWEKYAEKAVNHKVDSGDLGRIFAVLDKDHDGYVTFEDVLRFDPVTIMVTREPTPKRKEELVFDELDQQKAHAQLIRQRKAAVCHNLFFSSDHRNITATLQEIEMRKVEKGLVRKDGLDLLQDFARKYRETQSKPGNSVMRGDASSSDDDDADKEERVYRIVPGANKSERRISSKVVQRKTRF